MSPSTTRAATYEVESFRPSDRSGFLSLYETVFRTRRSADWFRWKYVDNPVADHVPIVVARRDGRVVGCRSFLPMRVAVDGAVRIAYQPCDTMVHPAHRRRGVFTRMNEAAIERYADGEPAFCFNFPNEQSMRGNLKFGWNEVGTVPMYYRPQHPATAIRRWLDAREEGDAREGVDGADGEATTGGADGEVTTDPTTTGGFARTASTSLADAHRALDRRLADADAIETIARYERPAEAPLEAIYRRAIPNGVHAVRDGAFYEWRFANPTGEYEAYVGSRDGTPVAALIASPADDHLRLVDALPRAVGAEPDAVERLLSAALARRSSGGDRGYVAAFGDVLTRPLRYRFVPDTRYPLGALLRPTSRTLLVRDLDPSSAVESRSIDDWTLSWFDLDAV